MNAAHTTDFANHTAVTTAKEIKQFPELCKLKKRTTNFEIWPDGRKI